jgi:SAM-dependent methyltransferase
MGTPKHPIVERVVRDVGGAFAAGLAYIGDRLGLFRALAASGPVTSVQLAGRLHLNERYLHEWLKGMVAAEYVEHDALNDTYFMTPDQQDALANEESPVFAAGAFQITIPSFVLTDRIVDAFRNGGGVPFADFGPEVPLAIDRLHRAAFERRLVSVWLAAVPGLQARLEQGITVLDVGCGVGRSTAAVAHAFPRSHVLGVDPDVTSIDHARRLAHGVPNATFHAATVAELGAERRYDLVLAIDCIHDMVDPVAALRAIRSRLATDGTLFWAEPTGSHRPMENRNPLGKMRANLSPFHCLTVSLAHGGAGLGTLIGEAGVRFLAIEAGFARMERVDVDDVFQQFFVVGG